MSGNERSEDQLRHERLCAYLFGELEDDERAAVEAELASDAELRAEHEKLAATIALVREAVPADADAADALAGSDVLSDATRSALSAAAARRGGAAGPAGSGGGLAPVHPWPVRVVRSPLTAAAAVLLALGGIAGLALHQGSPAPGTTRGAQTAAVRDASEASLERNARRSLAAEQRVAPRRAGESVDAFAPAETRTQLDADESFVSGGMVSEKAEDQPGVATAPRFTPQASEPAADPDAGRWAKQDLRDELASADRSKEKDERLGLLAETASAPPESAGEPSKGLGKLGYTSSPPSEGGESVSGLQTLGYADSAPPEDKEVTRAAEVHLVQSARARVSVTPGSASAGPGSPGPSSPGPSGPAGGAAGGATGSSGWFLGDGKKSTSTAQPGPGGESLGELLAFDFDSGYSGPRINKIRLIDDLGDMDGAGPFGGIAERQVDRGIDRISPQDLVTFCRIRPRETPSAMFFRCWGDNPFELAQLDPLSTFAADVDTASFALARNYLSRGLMPTKAQIRTEEFVNSFDSGVPAPTKDAFGIDLAMAPSLFGSRSEWMLRVVVRGKEVDKLERPPLALTFVVDTSGSMKQENRMELVKHALRLLVAELDQNDAISIVAFSTEARLVLPMTSAGSKAVIESAIFGLNPDGSTNAEAGLLMGYAQAAQGLTAGANNRVVLLSDGVANVGNVDQARLLDNVKIERSKGIYLNTIGVGMGNHNDALLEQLADKGDGICNYIDTEREAVRVLVDGFTGQFVPIARDVKIQVEFDPAQVSSYRLLGYENRAVADADFRNDAVDAGEVGAGHQVTALFEIVRNPTATNDGPLATARVRYKPPFAIDRAELSAEARQAAEVASEIEKAIEFRDVQTAFQGTTVGYQRAVLVAQLAEFLRRSVHARGDELDVLVSEMIRVEKVAEDPQFTELVTLVARNRDLIARHLPVDDAVARAIDEMTRHNYLQGKIAQLTAENHVLTEEILSELQSRNANLEQQLQELLEQQLKQRQER